MSNKNQKQTSTKISRRSVLKGAAVAAAAGMIPFKMNDAYAAVAPDKWDEEADILVIGAGGAGFAAGLEAANTGAKVIILEKLAYIGGSSIICGAGLAFAGTDIQIANNVNDSNELFYKDFMDVGKNANIPELVKAYVDNQLETYNWLKDAGVEFVKNKVTVAAGTSVPRVHWFSPPQLIKALSTACEAKGVKLILETAAQKLALDPKTGNIKGVFAVQGKKNITYGAKKGVILASGGFSLNKELLAKFAPPLVKAKTIVGLGSHGDGLKMAWACGADIQDMPHVKATFGFSLNPKTMADDFFLVYYCGAIIVNKEAKRFVNESLSYKLVADAALVQTDAVGYQLFDQPICDEAIRRHEARMTNLLKRDIVSAPTLAELAKLIGIDSATLEATVKEYNENVAKGVDPQFGRTTQTADYGKPSEIKTGPFYAWPSTAVLISTYGGILINGKAQVLNVYGEPIPGLYAAGEITGGVHGAAYVSGTAVGKALIFGRIAAKNALS